MILNESDQLYWLILIWKYDNILNIEYNRLRISLRHKFRIFIDWIISCICDYIEVNLVIIKSIMNILNTISEEVS